MNKKLVKGVSFLTLFFAFFSMFFNIKPFITEVQAASDTVQTSAALPLSYDFSSMPAGTKASDLGFDVTTPGENMGDAYIAQSPGKEGNSLYMYDKSVEMTDQRNFTRITKGFDAQNGILTVEMSYMQPGNTRERSTVFEVVYHNPTASVADRIAVRVVTDPSNEAFTQNGNTAPHVIAHYDNNQWYDIKAVIDTVNKQSSFYVNGVLCLSKEKFVDTTLDWVNEIYMQTPGPSSSNTAGQYVSNLKVSAQPAPTSAEEIVPPSGLYAFPRDKEIGINWTPMNYAVTQNVYASETPGGPYTLCVSKYNKTYLPTERASITGLGIGKTAVPLVNGKTYYVVVTVASNIRNADGTTSLVNSGYSNEVAIAPNSTVKLAPVQNSVIQDVYVNHAYYANYWSQQANLKVGDTLYGDAANVVTKLPAEYTGADWISPATASIAYAGQTLTTFVLNDDADVYVAMDTNVAVPPSWLSDWTKTGDVIEADNGAITYNVFKKSFEGNSTVNLGNNGLTSACNGYLIMAKRQPIDIQIDTVRPVVNNENFTVTGAVYDNVSLTVKLNGITVADSVYSAADSRFNFDMVLSKGANSIDIIAARNTGMLTKTYTVNYDTAVPVINLTSEPPILVTGNSLNISGYSGKDAALTIKLNGAAVVNSVYKAANENFSYYLSLSEGENTIEIIAVDSAGNQSVLSYKTTYVFRAGNMGFRNFTGNDVLKVTPSGEVMANAQLVNQTASKKQVILIFALYNSNNTMIRYSSVSVSMNSGETQNIMTGIVIPSDSNSYKVKAFVWDSINGMKPLSDQIKLQ